jgi:hypothetical protein
MSAQCPNPLVETVGLAHLPTKLLRMVDRLLGRKAFTPTTFHPAALGVRCALLYDSYLIDSYLIV